MKTMSEWWWVALAGLLSFLLTAGLRHYALSQSLMDIPNARSSHSVPTPRGGGVSIVVTFLLALLLLGIQQRVPGAALTAVAGAGALVAVIGFMDDHGHIAARWRLLGHFVAAAWALFWIGGLAPLDFYGMRVDLNFIGNVLAAFYLVWMLNLYNFMDGIDGIASIEALSVCCCASYIYKVCGFSELIWMPMLLASAVIGFFFWNFPPAKIFMGDAGSGFLGLVLGLLSLQAGWASPPLFWAWLILLGVFIVDATFTLIRRLLRKDKIYEAHRSHAYQFASRWCGRHLTVTLAVGLINVLWLLPLALWVATSGLDGVSGVCIAYVPLVLLAIRFNAGSLEGK
jgi:Fuc2NAc and GlcNAc transferase